MDATRRLITIPRRVYRHFMRDSLYRNSIYLLITLGINAASGLLFVIICTKLYSQKEVGYATALIGALGLAVMFSNIGMNRTIVRFLGRSANKSQDLMTKISMVAGISVIVGIIMCFFFHSFGLKQANLLTSIIFVVAVLITSIKGLFDNAFIATRATSGNLIENGLYNLTRLMFPLLFVGLGFIGIFSASLVGSSVAVIASVILLQSKLGFNLRARPTRSSLKGKWGFVFGSYTLDIISNFPNNVVPIIVLARFGPVQSALWYVAMQIILLLMMVTSSINQAMFAEMAYAEKQIGKFIKQAAIAMYSLVVPLSVIAFVVAPYVLHLIGANYVAAYPILRLMIVFVIIGIANYITGSILMYYKKIAYLTFVNVINGAVVIFYCLTIAHNLMGIAIGWVLGEIVNIILFVGGALYVINRNKRQESLVA